MRTRKRCRKIMGLALVVIAAATVALVSAHQWPWGLWVAFFLIDGFAAGAGLTAWWIAGLEVDKHDEKKTR